MNLTPITFFSGPMRSGKSTRLLAELHRHSYRKNTKTVFFRPSHDTREFISRHMDIGNGEIIVHKIVQPKDLLSVEADVIGLDELHFMPVEIVDVLLELYLQGKEIFVAGLNLDAFGKAWESSQRLLTSPEVNVVRLFSACEWCGSKHASRTYGIDGNSGVGDEKYQAICYPCWDTHLKEQQQILEV